MVDTQTLKSDGVMGLSVMVRGGPLKSDGLNSEEIVYLAVRKWAHRIFFKNLLKVKAVKSNQLRVKSGLVTTSILMLHVDERNKYVHVVTM